MEKGEVGALVGNVTYDIRRVAKSPTPRGRSVTTELNTWTVRLRLRELNGRSGGSAPTLQCKKHFGKTLWNMALPQAVHGLAPSTLTLTQSATKSNHDFVDL